ncbi:hypothetical protein NL676_038220 [Syzygium grande]|nr:hypothetical protein NL676_038220 [Syzygium grande]
MLAGITVAPGGAHDSHCQKQGALVAGRGWWRERRGRGRQGRRMGRAAGLRGTTGGVKTDGDPLSSAEQFEQG